MMKIRQTLTIILILGLLFISSCLKDDPNRPNTTYFYGHQDIPSINYYMPQALLEAMGETNLYFGENPPRLLADSCYDKDTIIVFKFIDQCFGMANMSFKDNSLEESSNTDKTYDFIKDTVIWKQFREDTLSPVFFNDTTLDPEVLRHAYLMGNDSYFTLYYYELRKEQHNYRPLNAAILSAELIADYVKFPVAIDTIIENSSDTLFVYDSLLVNRYLRNVKWGVETMKYFPKDNAAQAALNAELEADTLYHRPGHVQIITIDTLFIHPTR